MLAETLPTLPNQAGEYPAQRWNGVDGIIVNDTIAEEVPVALVYNGISHAVMLATPRDLEDFALGFSLSEGIVASAKDVYDIEVSVVDAGIEIAITISSKYFAALKERRRNLTGRTGCGICGVDSLEQAVRNLPTAPEGISICPEELHRAFDELRHGQQLHFLTGAVHAAGWADVSGRIELVREDVGRHNALDKLIGALAKRGAAFDAGFTVFTSRASCEMIQKAATAGMTLVAAISAPTGLAIRLADRCRLTLVGFARNGVHTAYANPHRILLDRS